MLQKMALGNYIVFLQQFFSCSESLTPYPPAYATGSDHTYPSPQPVQTLEYISYFRAATTSTHDPLGHYAKDLQCVITIKINLPFRRRL